GDQPLDTVAKRAGAAGLQLELPQRAPRSLRAGLEVIEEDARVIGHERRAQPAVGDLAGQLEPPRRERREIDRNVCTRLDRRPERFALAAGQRQLVDLALERHALAA